MVSSNSKYDQVMRGEDSFLLPEKLGHAIFKTKCAQCHAEPLFTDYSYRNIGIPLEPYLNDIGTDKYTVAEFNQKLQELGSTLNFNASSSQFTVSV